MFQLDVFNNTEPLKIYLVNVNDEVLGCINDKIEESSASLKYIFTQQYELKFDIVNLDSNKSWYNFLHEGMYLLVENIGLFKMNQPEISNSGQIERKSIIAYSVESELEDKTANYPVNLGTKESLEYLVKYDSNEDEELLNPYTGVPYDWIVLYNTFPEQLNILKDKVNDGYYGTPDINNEIVVTDSSKINELKEIFDLIPRLKCKITYQNNIDGSKDSILTEYVIVEYDENNTEIIVSYTLTDQFVTRINTLITFYTNYRSQLSLLSLVLDKTGWSVGSIYGLDDNDFSLCNRKFQFEINETIYSFLTQTFSKISECIVTFDKFTRTVNVTPVAEFGEDTGIIIGYKTLVNELNISTEEDKISTRLHVSGGDDLDITRVNFGNDYIDNLLYKINLKESNKYVYIPDSLNIKYLFYKGYVESKRNQYVNYSKQFEENLNIINELKYRVPNDGLKTDWGTYTLEELKTSLTYYKNLLVTLTSLYKEDYGQLGLNNDGSINETYIKITPYWWDYEAYKNIILEIQCAIDVFPYYDDISKWTSSQKSQYEEQIKAWETEWTLYGINELEAKISSYEQNMKIMLDEQDSKSAVIKANDNTEWGIKEWTQTCIDSNTQLTDDEKAMYGFSELLYRYDIYMDYYNNMVSAKTYLATLKTQLETLETEQENIQTQLNAIKEQVEYKSYFTEDECKILYRLIRDSDYSNDNILTTSIDTVSDKYDRMLELLDDAKEQLSIFSRPQINFTVDSENLLALSEFMPMWEKFIPGNYIYVQYKDNNFVKLRLVGYTFNPCIPTSNNLQIEFSNFVLSRSTYNDWASILGKGSSGSSRSSSSRGGGRSSGEDYGNIDDIDITISNTLLSKLLNSELFGTRVTDVILDTIAANKLTARLATFGGLANGTTKVDGKCITTGYIIDADYNGTNGNINNTSGSIINLETGKFSFAGGKLKYDSSTDTLTVQGTIKADAGEIGDFTLANGALYTGQKSTDGTNVAGIRISQNEICLSNGTADSTIKLAKGVLIAGDKLTYDPINGLNIEGLVIADKGMIGGFSIGDNIANNYNLLRVSYHPTVPHISGDQVRQYAIQAPDPDAFKGNGQYYTTTATANFLYIRSTTNYVDDSDNTDWNYLFRVFYNGNIYSGNVYCGYDSDSSTYTKDVRCNNVYCNSVITPSDKKLKNHIQYLSDNDKIESFIYNLEPVLFSYKNDNSKHFGLYAQDVNADIDKLINNTSLCQKIFLNEDTNVLTKAKVNKNQNEFTLGLNYSELIAPLIAVVQKQNKRITILEQLLDINNNS